MNDEDGPELDRHAVLAALGPSLVDGRTSDIIAEALESGRHSCLVCLDSVRFQDKVLHGDFLLFFFYYND